MCKLREEGHLMDIRVIDTGMGGREFERKKIKGILCGILTFELEYIKGC
jgi:hypothetical protein